MPMPMVTATVSKEANGVSLVQGHDYQVVEIDDSYFRIIDEGGDPILYPKNYFLDCEVSPPAGWMLRQYEEGEYHSLPSELSAKGFFEDYHDRCPDAIRVFKEYCRNNRAVAD